MEITDGITFNDIIENYLNEFEVNMNVKEVVYKVVKDNLINKKALRNKCIVDDFDASFKENNKSIQTMYDDLAFKYNLSLEMIKKIVLCR